MLQCKICNENFINYAGLGSHITRKHNITKSEYYLKYINSEIPKCKNCGKLTTFINLCKGFSTFCSRKCANSNNDKLLTWKLNNIKKYGVENYAKTDECKEKIKQTCVEKYGVEHTFQVKEFRQKAKETLLEKYGVTSPVQSCIIKERMQNTSLLRYGVRHYVQTEDFKNFMHDFNKNHVYKRKSKYFYNNIYFDSSWELAYYLWLSENNIKFEYHPDIYFEYSYNNKIYKYYPDFIVNDELQEVKGDQFFDKDNNYINPYNNEKNTKAYNKYQCILCNNIKILRYNDIKYILNKYRKKFLKQFKV